MYFLNIICKLDANLIFYFIWVFETGEFQIVQSVEIVAPRELIKMNGSAGPQLALQ